MKLARTKHYAKSLAEIGKENNCFSSLVADLKDVNEKFDVNLEFKNYLLNKQVPLVDKKKALKHVFADFISVKTYNFLFLLIKENKLNYLGEIISIAEKMNLQAEDSIEVIVESVIPLEPKAEEKIIKIIEQKSQKKVVLRNIIERSLLGGMRVIIGDTVVEGSLRGRIERLKDKIQDLS